MRILPTALLLGIIVMLAFPVRAEGVEVIWGDSPEIVVLTLDEQSLSDSRLVNLVSIERTADISRTEAFQRMLLAERIVEQIDFERSDAKELLPLLSVGAPLTDETIKSLSDSDHMETYRSFLVLSYAETHTPEELLRTWHFYNEHPEILEAQQKAHIRALSQIQSRARLAALEQKLAAGAN